MSDKYRYDQQVGGLVRGLLLSIIESTDEEIQEDARLAGADLDANATRLKRRFDDITKTFRQRKFVAAQDAYKAEVQRLQHRFVYLPSSPIEQRALLRLVATQQVQRGVPLTAKFRDFDNLSDADVASLLEELAALGLIPATGSED
jgi:hypothetical protein